MAKITPAKLISLAESPQNINNYKKNPIKMLRILYDVFGANLVFTELLKELKNRKVFSLSKLMIHFADVKLTGTESCETKLILFCNAGYSIPEIEEALKKLKKDHPDIFSKYNTTPN